MKKILSVILCMLMAFGICSGFSSGAMTKVYYPSGAYKVMGRSVIELAEAKGASLLPDKIDAQDKAYEEIVVMYAQDGRSLDVLKSQVELYKGVGWYEEPVTLMYAQDGRTLPVKTSEMTLYESVGWYREPVTLMYAPDGRTRLTLQSEIETYKNVGWYLSPDDIPAHLRPKLVAITYDDGPSSQTPRILDCLEKYGAKATFFVVGRNINKYPNALKRASSLGMEIGNHTANHPKLTSLSASGIKSEVSATDEAVISVTGVRPTLLRPPYGSYNSTVSSVAGKPLILWSIDTLDWKTRNADSTVKEVLENVKDGSIILMHDLYSQTAEATERLVPELIKRGFKLVTVSELANAKGVSMVAGKSYGSIK